MTPDGKERNQRSWSPFMAGRRMCPGDTFSRMSQNVIGLMFFLAMPNAEFEDKTYYDLNEPMPLTNVLVYPRTQVKLVLKEPLRVGDVPHQSTEEDDDDEEEEDIGSREAV